MSIRENETKREKAVIFRNYIENMYHLKSSKKKLAYLMMMFDYAFDKVLPDEQTADKDVLHAFNVIKPNIRKTHSLSRFGNKNAKTPKGDNKTPDIDIDSDSEKTNEYTSNTGEYTAIHANTGELVFPNGNISLNFQRIDGESREDLIKRAINWIFERASMDFHADIELGRLNSYNLFHTEPQKVCPDIETNENNVYIARVLRRFNKIITDKMEKNGIEFSFTSINKPDKKTQLIDIVIKTNCKYERKMGYNYFSFGHYQTIIFKQNPYKF